MRAAELEREAFILRSGIHPIFFGFNTGMIVGQKSRGKLITNASSKVAGCRPSRRTPSRTGSFAEAYLQQHGAGYPGFLAAKMLSSSVALLLICIHRRIGSCSPGTKRILIYEKHNCVLDRFLGSHFSSLGRRCL